MIYIDELCMRNKTKKKLYHALAGNRTRASRVAGENSTTEPPVQARKTVIFFNI